MKILSNWNPFISYPMIRKSTIMNGRSGLINQATPSQKVNHDPRSLRHLVRNQFGNSYSSKSWNPQADLNRDGMVNVIDKVAVRELDLKERIKKDFGKTSQDPDFDQRSDVNGDGVVNVLDKVMVRNRLINLKA